MANGTATMNTVCSAWLKASMIRSRCLGGQRLDLGRVRRDRAALQQLELRGRRGRAQLGEQPVVEDGAERGDAERAADRPEERRGRRRGAEQRVRDRVLDGHDEHLHDEPEPEPDDEHEERHEPVGACRGAAG